MKPKAHSTVDSCLTLTSKSATGREPERNLQDSVQNARFWFLLKKFLYEHQQEVNIPLGFQESSGLHSRKPASLAGSLEKRLP